MWTYKSVCKILKNIDEYVVIPRDVFFLSLEAKE